MNLPAADFIRLAVFKRVSGCSFTWRTTAPLDGTFASETAAFGFVGWALGCVVGRGLSMNGWEDTGSDSGQFWSVASHVSNAFLWLADKRVLFWSQCSFRIFRHVNSAADFAWPWTCWPGCLQFIGADSSRHLPGELLKDNGGTLEMHLRVVEKWLGPLLFFLQWNQLRLATLCPG